MKGEEVEGEIKSGKVVELAEDDIRAGWKILTHDWRSPFRGGKPIKIEKWPHLLPAVRLDTSGDECAAGWNYCGELAAALSIAGLWPTGKPSKAFLVEASEDAIERGNKRRASSLTMIRPATRTEIEAAIREFSTVFGAHADYMVQEQLMWLDALARPAHDVNAVEAGLLEALAHRQLKKWSIKRYSTARDARDVRVAWDAWDAWNAWVAWDAWNAWNAWVAWDAWNAWDALIASFTVRQSRIEGRIKARVEAHLSRGLRDAYRNGLEIALPTSERELGYAMVEETGA